MSSDNQACRAFVKEAVAIANFEGTPTFNQLSIEAGNQLLALDSSLCYGWRWVCNVKGQSGYVPSSFVRDVAQGNRRAGKAPPSALLDRDRADVENRPQHQNTPTTVPEKPSRATKGVPQKQIIEAHKTYRNWQTRNGAEAVLAHKKNGNDMTPLPSPLPRDQSHDSLEYFRDGRPCSEVTTSIDRCPYSGNPANESVAAPRSTEVGVSAEHTTPRCWDLSRHADGRPSVSNANEAHRDAMDAMKSLVHRLQTLYQQSHDNITGTQSPIDHVSGSRPEAFKERHELHQPSERECCHGKADLRDDTAFSAFERVRSQMTHLAKVFGSQSDM